MKSLRGEFFFGYFTLDILHWIFCIGHFSLDILHWTFYIRWFLKVSPFAKVKPFLNTSQNPDSVRQPADLLALKNQPTF